MIFNYLKTSLYCVNFGGENTSITVVLVISLCYNKAEKTAEMISA